MALGFLQACSLPALLERQESFHLSQQESADTPFGRALAAEIRAHPDQSAIYPVSDAMDAFALRMLLVQQAQRSLDVQYYIWRKDATGILLLDALKKAADRGVRVRLLLDDNGINDLDSLLMSLHQHPQIEVRLFNPFPWRTFKRLGFVVDFSRLNRRMHNKSMTVDAQLTLVGGRNIGDEYFAATGGVVFADLDLLAAGPIATEVSNDFDLYWNSRSAYPLDSLWKAAPTTGEPPLRQALAAVHELPHFTAYVEAAKKSSLLQAILTEDFAFEWAPVRMISDDPAKVLGKVEQNDLFPVQMFNAMGAPNQTIDVVSPYFVPTAAGTQAFTHLMQQGVRVRILTNGLEATDVLAVHAGYAKHRNDLLERGAKLYEVRKLSDKRLAHHGGWGSSASSLHAKTFVVDGKRVFVGSFNFDPRSANLNTELGFVVEGSSLARLIPEMFDQHIALLAYRLTLSEQGNINWLLGEGESKQTLAREPGARWWTRAWLSFLSTLPIEGLL